VDITRGRREPRDLTVETFSDGRTQSKAMFGKSRSVSESSVRHGEAGNSSDDLPMDLSDITERDSISFISGNPFVETTRGILHLYKEK